MKKEWKIGEIRQINGEWYQYVRGGCKDCDLSKDSFYCDHLIETNVCNSKGIPKKLEKVGQPLIDKGHIQFQRYKIYLGPIIDTTENIGYIIGYINEDTIAIEIKQIKDDMEEKKLNLKPFDIQKAREGKPVCTRDGRKARILCFDRLCCDEISTIVACVLSKDGKDENVIIYSSDGFMADKQHPYADDLMMIPEKKEGWAKVRKDINLYDTKEEADRKMIGNDEYVTAKVCWEK